MHSSRATTRPLRIDRNRLLGYRLRAQRLEVRLPPGSAVSASRYGLQDSAPRDALLSLHARIENCSPDAWQDPGLLQTYSPRAAVFVLPATDFGVFTIGRLPFDPDARAEIEEAAERICRELDGNERRGGLPGLRAACATGRIALRWTTSALYVREIPRPTIDEVAARHELCRRHLQGFGPSTPKAFAWWAGLSQPNARTIWKSLPDELVEVEVEGQRCWILAAEEEALRRAEPAGAVRLLPAPDLRVLGQDKTGLFAGPGIARHRLYDTFHPGGVLAGGKIIGSWGRKGGKVEVLIDTADSSADVVAAIEAEALAMPIPGVTMSFEVSRH